MPLSSESLWLTSKSLVHTVKLPQIYFRKRETNWQICNQCLQGLSLMEHRSAYRLLGPILWETQRPSLRASGPSWHVLCVMVHSLSWLVEVSGEDFWKLSNPACPYLQGIENEPLRWRFLSRTWKWVWQNCPQWVCSIRTASSRTEAAFVHSPLSLMQCFGRWRTITQLSRFSLPIWKILVILPCFRIVVRLPRSQWEHT